MLAKGMVIMMSTCRELLEGLAQGKYDERLAHLYCCTGEGLLAQRGRVQAAIRRYEALFSATEAAPAAVFSGPGRTELGGNHTDHQRGRVLAGAVNMDMLAVGAPNGSSKIRVQSEGYPVLTVDLGNLTPQAGEQGRSEALVRGVAACIAGRGYALSGFDAYITSSVPAGSGLSSSAAYEVLIGTILNHLYCGDALTAIEIAQIGQRAENEFFGKPCGLMDQMASAVGSAVAIDFADPAKPLVRKLDFDFTACGYTLCIIDSGADHADLTDEYAAITLEMGGVARALGKTVLREVDEGEFTRRIPALRKELGDRAILRALHFFAEDRRAAAEAQALDDGDFEGFLALVRASGISSALHLQNTYAAGTPRQQAVPLAIAMAEQALDGAGAVRVHGGGFAGTIQAFVPNALLPVFQEKMEALLGKNMCHVLSIRPEGGCTLFD
ncbi:MAG: galactokinase family protein [Pseudoflavonifractor sp.]